MPFTSNQQNTQTVNSKSSLNLNNNNNNNNVRYEPKSVLEPRRSSSPVTDQKPVSGNEISGAAVCWDESSTQLEDHVLLTHFEDFDSLMREFGLHEDSNSTNPKPITTTTISQLAQVGGGVDHYLSLPAEFIQPPSTQLSSNTTTTFESTQFVPTDFSLQEISAYGPLSNNHAFDLSNDSSAVRHNMIANNWNNNNIGTFDYVDELIRLAECFQTNSFHLSHVILGRLNQRLRSPTGKALQRAAFYFKEALQTLLTGSTRPTRPSPSPEVIQSIKAHRAFSTISPLPMFSSFTANQAVLEAVDGSMLVHVIDFDIGLGMHWASFLKELSDKAESRKTGPPVLRITAVVGEEYAVESQLIRENLTQFARELSVGFDIDFVLIRTFEFLSFKAIKFVEGEKTAILFSPTIFRRVGTGFLNDLRRIAPHVVVHLDGEGLMGFGTSFRQTVIEGLEFYSTLLESLEAATCGGGEDWMRKIERFVLFPKILEAVGAAGRRGTPWREAFVAAGLRPVALSHFADFQADYLISTVQGRGFHVARRQAEMLLCWQERPLVATSAWRF